MLETKDIYELDIDVKTSQEIEHIKNVILEHFPEKYFSKTNLQDLIEEGQTTLYSTYKVYKEFVFCILN